jgi:cyclophilin family peptidyl-prolyl cis-trans isomerase/HEAT repeat protein
MKEFPVIIAAVIIFVSSAVAQVPTATLITIVKAEDARRYDKTIENLIKSPDLNVRHRSALAAGRIGDERAIPALTYLLESEAAVNMAAMAAFAIGEIESVKGADAILKALADAKTPHEVRARAVEAAGKIAAANAKDSKAKELAAAILNVLDFELTKRSAPYIDVVRLALTAALRARPAGADEIVRKYLAFTDPDVVADALNTLTRLRAKNANRDARDLLATSINALVRANAVRLLGAAEDKDALDILLKVATEDTDSRVRVSAIRSLAALRDTKAAEPLLKRGEELFASYSKAKEPNFIPVEQNEFIEIAVALGRLLANTDNERADKLFADFGKLDKGHTPEIYIARVRIWPKRGDGSSPELTDWRQYSTLAQVVGEFASIEPKSEVGKAMKTEAPGIIRPLAKAFAEADPSSEGKRMMAGPDALQAFARFKTEDLGEMARKALKNKDVQMRATAAGILADLPLSKENVEALKTAFKDALLTDKMENDAQLAIMDAIFKLDKKESVGSMVIALSAEDYLVRKKAFELLGDKELQTAPGVSTALDLARARQADIVRPPTLTMTTKAGTRIYPSGTKLGQILNTDTDYRRAVSRKNGSIEAVLTTEKGTFTIVFNPEEAPLTVDNFVKLARTGYFNGLEVHRVVPNFVMQDGDPRGDGNGGPGWSIRCEINMLPYDRGAVGMALSGKDTGGSQWFVTHSPQPHLDGGYTVFGHVNETDMKVVDNIVRGDKIISVKIIEGRLPQRTQRISSKK